MSTNKSYKTREEILVKGREAIGIPFKQIDQTNRLTTGKGAIGSVMEESWFGYNINNEANPDFSSAGVELKVTPYKSTRNGLRAKERLVCNIINYMEEYKTTFQTSSFWKKCNTMLLMFYEHKENLSKGDFTIDEVVLFSFPKEDFLIIEKDWEIIVGKIKNGKAHELSERDTLYLGACTKGATAASVRQQPFSDISAKQRAFSLKESYMTYLLNKYILGNEADERIIKNPSLLKEQSFEEIIVSKISQHFGKTQQQLLAEFELKTSAKNVNELLLARMLGIKGRLSSTEEFQKANIILKTIRVNSDDSITESMSFPAFNFQKIVTENWEDCDFKNMLEQMKFLFVIFRYNNINELIFDNILFWNIPEPDLDEIRTVWERTVAILKQGVQLKTIGKRTYNNFPKSSENRVAHVRPHARNSQDTLTLPDGRQMPKQCFWLNNTYIREQLQKNFSPK